MPMIGKRWSWSARVPAELLLWMAWGWEVLIGCYVCLLLSFPTKLFLITGLAAIAAVALLLSPFIYALFTDGLERDS